MKVLIRMSSVSIAVSDEKLADFMERLSKAGHSSVAETLRTKGKINQDQKAAALAVMENWLVSEDVDSLGTEIMDLRTELMRDTKTPPFDD
jgi:hypothetical protein